MKTFTPYFISICAFIITVDLYDFISIESFVTHHLFMPTFLILVVNANLTYVHIEVSHIAIKWMIF